MNFLSVEPDESEGTPHVELFGKTVPLQERRFGALNRLIVGIRPEHFALGEGPISFCVRPTMIESLGSEKYLYFDGGQQRIIPDRNSEEEGSSRLIARVSHSGPLDEHAEIVLSFDPRNLYLFDADTEAAL